MAELPTDENNLLDSDVELDSFNSVVGLDENTAEEDFRQKREVIPAAKKGKARNGKGKGKAAKKGKGNKNKPSKGNKNKPRKGNKNKPRKGNKNSKSGKGKRKGNKNKPRKGNRNSKTGKGKRKGDKNRPRKGKNNGDRQ